MKIDVLEKKFVPGQGTSFNIDSTKDKVRVGDIVEHDGQHWKVVKKQVEVNEAAETLLVRGTMKVVPDGYVVHPPEYQPLGNDGEYQLLRVSYRVTTVEEGQLLNKSPGPAHYVRGIILRFRAEDFPEMPENANFIIRNIGPGAFDNPPDPISMFGELSRQICGYFGLDREYMSWPMVDMTECGWSTNNPNYIVYWTEHDSEAYTAEYVDIKRRDGYAAAICPLYAPGSVLIFRDERQEKQG